ncbi:MAG: hypothetical protein AABX00_04185 [Nanoarchaeota archaeon]
MVKKASKEEIKDAKTSVITGLILGVLVYYFMLDDLFVSLFNLGLEGRIISALFTGMMFIGIVTGVLRMERASRNLAYGKR